MFIGLHCPGLRMRFDSHRGTSRPPQKDFPMSFTRTRPSNNWTPLSVVDATEFDDIDAKTADAVDGVGGGAYAPTQPITIQGKGVQDAALLTHTISTSVADELVTGIDQHRVYVTGGENVTNSLTLRLTDDGDNVSREIVVDQLAAGVTLVLQEQSTSTIMTQVMPRDTMGFKVILERIGGFWVVVAKQQDNDRLSEVASLGTPVSPHTVDKDYTLFFGTISTPTTFNFSAAEGEGSVRVLHFTKIDNAALTFSDGPTFDTLDAGFYENLALTFVRDSGGAWRLLNKPVRKLTRTFTGSSGSETVSPVIYDTAHFTNPINGTMALTIQDGEFDGQDFYVFADQIAKPSGELGIPNAVSIVASTVTLIDVGMHLKWLNDEWKAVSTSPGNAQIF
jgi:hypothetical protein